MESVAVLSDIHGVPPALDAVLAESAYPDIAEWTDYFLHSRASDADALAVMAPRDGRLPAAVAAVHLVRVVTRHRSARKTHHGRSPPTGDLL